MTKIRTVNVILTVLVAIVIVEAGALVMISNDRSTISDDLQTEEQKAETVQYLVSISSRLQEELLLIDRATSDAANDLQGSALNDGLTRTVLEGVVNASSNIINVATTDIDGTILAAEPSQYSSIEGAYIGDQDTMKVALERGQPAISSLYAVVEGFNAVYIVYPVLDEQGIIVGTITTLFRPDLVVENITEALESSDISIMVIQDDGVVLYDVDADQVGRNTFTDPLYQNFTKIKEIASRMVNEGSGDDSYSFQRSGDEVCKEIIWTTVGLMDARWSVSAIREV
jgi:branched-chain amino acid transport system substrate-binding protein